MQEVEESIRLTLTSPHLGYLLVTRFRDHAGIRAIRGCLKTGLTSEINPSAPPQPPPLRSHQDMQQLLQLKFGLFPFACFGSNRDPNDARWLSFHAGTLQSPNGKLLIHNIRISAFERMFVALHRLRTGNYPCFYPWNPVKFRVQLLFNAFSGGHVTENLRLLTASFLPAENSFQNTCCSRIRRKWMRPEMSPTVSTALTLSCTMENLYPYVWPTYANEFNQ